MKITGSGQIQSKTVKKTSRKGSSGASSFSSELHETREGGAAGHAAGVAGTSPLASVDALLALQEVPDAATGRSKGLKRAEEMLDLLEEIRKGILLGSISMPNLRTLADMARNQRGRTNDKKLDSILADIELRAEVELAKLGL